MAELRTLYPPIEYYEKGMLKVSNIHEIYYELSGNKDSDKAIVFLHGGPGGGTDPSCRQFFDPKAYKIVLFDQRGCGNSTPKSCLEENTSWHLVEDIEKLREHLKIDRWVVFGGSWGSTLALLYAEKYPEKVKALVLRGIFTLRRKELVWFYQEGASFIFPDAWDKYLEHIPPGERGDLISAYYRRLTSPDQKVRQEAAKVWTIWELSTSRLYIDPEYIARATDDFADVFARIEAHYFVNGGFFERDDEILANTHKLKGIPGVIVQGRYDVVCPATSAWELKKKWQEADLKIVMAGHSAKEPEILSELVKACDKYRDL